MENVKTHRKSGKIVKKFLSLALKLGIAALIVGVLFFRNPGQILDALRNFNYWWLLLASAVYFLHMIVASLRWRELCLMLGIKIGVFEAISLTLQTYFFSLVVPGGAIGGDVVKMGVLSSRSPKGNKLEGAFSVLMDRIIGMIALFGAVLILLPFSMQIMLKAEIPGFETHQGWEYLLVAGVVGVCLIGLIASGMIFFHRLLSKIPPFGYLMRRIDRATDGMVQRICEATEVYSKQWPKLTLLTVISVIFIHAEIALVLYIIFCGMPDATVSIMTVLTASLIGSIVGLIPIFPAGVGGRDFATVLLLVAGGMAAGPAKSGQMLFTALLIFFNLIGGVFFVCDPGRKITIEKLEEEVAR